MVLCPIRYHQMGEEMLVIRGIVRRSNITGCDADNQISDKNHQGDM